MEEITRKRQFACAVQIDLMKLESNLGQLGLYSLYYIETNPLCLMHPLPFNVNELFLDIYGSTWQPLYSASRWVGC